MDNRLGMLCAFLGGAAAGSAAALLMAPRSGRETRDQIKELAERGVRRTTALPDAVKDASGAAKQAFNETYEARA